MRYVCLILVLGFFSLSEAQDHQETKTFVFGDIPPQATAISIGSHLSYDSKRGYGFDFATAKNAIFRRDGFTASSPTYFSIKLPEGNYKIEISLGSNAQDSETTVKAESRRLMLAKINIPKNKRIDTAMVVHVRTSQIDDQHKVKLKKREFDELNWDNKLTLEFLGNPAIKRIKITPMDKVTTVFLAGDSTVTDQDLEPWASWGQYITTYFNTTVVVANYASSGASLSSFKDSMRLQKILHLMKAGDYLFIEFGHNDQKRKGVGIGPWSSYTDLLTGFINSARAKGGIPVLLTPTQRRSFGEHGKLKATHGDYPDAMRAVAKKLNVPLIDLTQLTTILYETWGDDTSRKAFVQYPAHTFPDQDKALEDNTHFNNFGAHEIALSVVQGIKDLDLEVGQYLRNDIPVYSPEKPNDASKWILPMSQRFEAVKPDGN